MRRMRYGLLALVIPLMSAQPSQAQWLNSFLEAQRNDNAREHHQRVRQMARDRASDKCSPDLLPAADRRRMEAEFAQRIRRDGRASAEAWVQEQGRRFRAQLVADGICQPSAGASGRGAKATARSGDKQRLNKHGGPCATTRVEQRVTPGLGGAAMSMGMVVVCDD